MRLPVSARTLVEVTKFRLDDVLDVSAVPIHDRPTKVPFLDLHFRANHLVKKDGLRGPGIYGLSFTSPEATSDPGVIYIGKYRGTEANPFGWLSDSQQQFSDTPKIV